MNSANNFRCELCITPCVTCLGNNGNKCTSCVETYWCDNKNDCLPCYNKKCLICKDASMNCCKTDILFT